MDSQHHDSADSGEEHSQAPRSEQTAYGDPSPTPPLAAPRIRALSHSDSYEPSFQENVGHDSLYFGQLSSSPQPSSGVMGRDRSFSSPLAATNSSGNPPHNSYISTHRSKLKNLASAVEHQRSRRMKEQWTVFGQLLEDDQTPGQRGSNTPVHTVAPSTRRNNPPLTLPSSYFHPSRPSSSAPSASSAAALARSAHGVTRQVEQHRQSVEGAQERTSNTPSASSDVGSERLQSHVVGLSNQTENPKARIWYPASFKGFSLTPLQKNILKCAVAYFLASLFTFVPLLSGFLSDIVPNGGSSSGGPSPSGHMVATVAVYFNPAKTIGAMVEADIYCLMASVYSAGVCLLFMSMLRFFEGNPGYEWLANASVFLCLGVAMSFVAWMKIWMAKPSFNTACSMTAIIIFFVVVKEGDAQTLMHVTFTVLVGSTVSNIVCAVMWPQSATTNLQNALAKATDSFATILDMTTSTFLLPGFSSMPQDKLLLAVENHQASFTALKRSLQEAKSEWSDPRMRGADNQAAYADAVEGLTRLAQHLNGLRDGIRQRSAASLGKNHSHAKKSFDSPELGKDEVTAEMKTFWDLPEDAKRSMKTLSEQCASTLRQLKRAFIKGESETGPNANHEIDFNALCVNTRNALRMFETASNTAVMASFKAAAQTETSPADKNPNPGLETPEKNMDEETILSLYFFLFTLQEFSRELMDLVGVMKIIHTSEIEIDTKSRHSRLISFCGGILCCLPLGGDRNRRNTAIFDPKAQHQSRPRLKRLASLMPVEPRSPFPRTRPHARNTIQTPSALSLTLIGRLKQRCWALGARLKEPDLRFAIKTGMATAILAGPAFFDTTRPLFMDYRGEWTLISFFIVMSPTVGATNFLSLQRIFGTLLGATTAAVLYSLFPDNPYVLSIFGFFFSIPCFYYIVATPKHASSGRFILLTYNLTALFCYNLRDLPSVDPITIAMHRSITVVIGVLWAFLVSRWWWPSEARRELSKALSDFCLNIGCLYSQLVETYSVPPQVTARRIANNGQTSLFRSQVPSETTSLLAPEASGQLNSSIRRFMAMELHLQIKLIALQDLLAQTQNEPRLKGPFPVHLYRTILTSLQIILDKLHTMRCVTTKEEWYTTVRASFIIPVNPQRREMVGNVILYFSTLASAFATKRALPPYLPPAEEARIRLVNAIRGLTIVKNRDVENSHHLLYLAYVLMMKGVIRELDFLGATCQDAFGVIGQSREDFEALFTTEGDGGASRETLPV